MNWILASGSPRRKELLALIHMDFEVLASDADEQVEQGLTPQEAVAAIARQKAQAIYEAGHKEDLVIGADTIVVVEDRILGKPNTPQRAVEMLRQLQGRSHMVYTAVQVLSPLGERHLISGTCVHFAPMDETEIQEYVQSAEPLDKAGAYGIQGLGSRFVQRIEGDYYTVMGLPVSALYRLLRELFSKNGDHLFRDR